MMRRYNLWVLMLATTLLLVLSGVRSTVTDDEDPTAQDINEEPNEPIDEIIVNSANTSSEFDFFYDENAQFLKVEYDMVYSYEEWVAFQDANGYSSDLPSRKKRTAGIRPGRSGRRWTSNIVPFQFANHFSGRDIRTIRSAINDWERYTCLDFQQRNSGNRIYFKNGGGCYSRVGMVGGAQEVGLAPGCRVKGVVIHEIGHALGLHHEQTRPDRDQHVRIIRRNIPSRMYYNFQKNTWNTILNMGIPYDYTSIMHYGKTAFSTNGQLTIQTINPRYQNVIGNRHGLSFGDIKSINIMYNCKRHTRGCTKTDASCPGQGFVGKDCTCVCPGGSLRRPTVACSGGGGGTTPPPRPTPRPTQPPTPRPTPRPGECQDQHRSCSYWSNAGECNANPAYMHVYCKRSCNKCSGGGGTTRPTCTDKHYACPQWRRYGYCNYRYQAFVRSNCKRSCGLCGSRYSNRGASSSTASCTDSNTLCPSWSRRGECTRNPGYMRYSCRLSCRECSPADEAPTSSSNSCRDYEDHCSYWSGLGYCTSNSGYMRFMCKDSCGLCTTD